MGVGEMRCAPVQIRPSLVHANRSCANVDIGLPGMNGYELAVKMREARPRPAPVQDRVNELFDPQQGRAAAGWRRSRLPGTVNALA